MMELKPKELEQLAKEFGAIKYGVQDSKLTDWYEEQANVTLYKINEVCIERKYKIIYSNAEIAEHEIEDCDYTHVYLMFDNEEKAKQCQKKKLKKIL